MKITFIKTGKRLKENPKKISKQKENLKKISKQKENSKKISNQNIKEKNNYKIKRENNEVNSKNEKNRLSFFKDVIKKNQIVVLTVALMLITAGYMNYNNENSENITLAEIGDARLVSTNIAEEQKDNENFSQENNNALENKIQEENKTQDESNTNEIQEKNIIQEENTTENNLNEENLAGENIIKETNVNQSDYFAKTRLERETMYSQMLEAYQKILENEKIPADQKSIASNEIKNINDRINAISISENLIKTKGFDDVILLINDNNVNVVVKRNENLKDEEVAQITNIVSRELKTEIENIHISIHN